MQVPLDGHIVYGEALVSTEHITGEALPVRRTRGENVLAAALNHDGVLVVKSTKISSESTPARIAKLTEEAQVGFTDVAILQYPISASYFLYARRACSSGCWSTLKAHVGSCSGNLQTKASTLKTACVKLIRTHCTKNGQSPSMPGTQMYEVLYPEELSSVLSLYQQWIMTLVQGRRPQLHRWLDEFSEVYVKSVLAATGLSFIGLRLMGVPVMSNASSRGALYRAIGLLTTASPCALVLVPLAYVAALAAITKR